VLLSFGPSAALVWSPEHLTDWSFFGGVAPLVALGLVWSVWRLLVVRLSSRVHRDPTGAADGSPEGSTVTAPRTGRLRFELNAAAAALLLISIVMFKADPLPVQEGTSLPTYLGERIQAQDVRTKLDLRQAMAASDAYAVRNGSYRGFDAAAGLRMDPTLAWSDGHVASTRSGTVPALTMSIERASGDTARIAARSDGGAVFCMQRTGDGSLRYGRAAGEGDPSLFERAIARCGSTPWSASAVRMPDTARMCDGVDRSGGYLICRMVQVLITDTMRRTKPA